MAESGGAESEDGRPDLSIGDDLDAEDVCQSWSAIRTKGAEDKVLAFLIEDKDAAEHVRWYTANAPCECWCNE